MPDISDDSATRAPDWQPIATAPPHRLLLICGLWQAPDSVIILSRVEDGPEVFIAKLFPGMKQPWRHVSGPPFDCKFSPTHWMLLPEPPP